MTSFQAIIDIFSEREVLDEVAADTEDLGLGSHREGMY